MLSDVNAEAVQKAAEQVKSRYPSSEAIAVKCDVSKEDDVKALVDKAVETFGRLDVMVSDLGPGESLCSMGTRRRAPVRDMRCRTDGPCALDRRPPRALSRRTAPDGIAFRSRLTAVQQRRHHAPQVSRRRTRTPAIWLCQANARDDDAVNTEEKIWDLTQAINVKGVWYGCKYAVIAMRNVSRPAIRRSLG